MAKKATKNYFSSFHAQSFDAKRMDLLIEHLMHADSTRGHKASKKVEAICKRIDAQAEDLEENTLPNQRVRWMIRVCETLNGTEAYEGKRFQPRGTKALVTALRACLTA